ncbi:uncharacterized protein KY384_004727 [Bacidia gigantensis]|uniref:uncharacterized protein n=1 Tax=Bacidia gigantensis TaxID=2732470 RepID=UPI001D04E97E|nr:uncharacterized protein KY384_004727 [Bacidia gigantensis]KAG8530227.1 hypothetical protein KY384_004727 [Bacidia gigantensis]
MDKIPNEVLEQIIDDLAPFEDPGTLTDLKAVRLANKRLCHTATPHLFRAVPLWMSIRNITKLKQISEHPQIRHFVKEIRFSPISFGSAEKGYGYRHTIEYDLKLYQSPVLKQYSSKAVLDLTMQTHLSGYNSYVQDTTFLKNESIGLRILTEALAALSGLDEIHIDIFNDIIGAKELHERLGFLNGHELIWDGLHSTYMLIEALAGACKSPSVVKIIVRDRQRISEQPSLHDISKRLPVVGVVWDVIPQNALVDAIIKTGADVSLLFKNVKAFDGFLLLGGSQSIADQNAYADCLKDVLDHAPRIEELRLNIRSNVRTAYPDDFARTWGYVPYTCFFPKLRKLEICSFQATVVEVTSFFKSHATTLENVLIFNEIWRYPRDWHSVVADLRKYDFKRLISFIIGDPERRDPYPFKSTNVTSYVKGLTEDDGLDLS